MGNIAQREKHVNLRAWQTIQRAITEAYELTQQDNPTVPDRAMAANWIGQVAFDVLGTMEGAQARGVRAILDEWSAIEEKYPTSSPPRAVSVAYLFSALAVTTAQVAMLGGPPEGEE